MIELKKGVKNNLRWFEFITVMKIVIKNYHCHENLVMMMKIFHCWKNLSARWKYGTVMKIYHCNENISLWGRCTMVIYNQSVRWKFLPVKEICQWGKEKISLWLKSMIVGVGKDM